MKHQYNRVVVLLNDFEKIDTLLERAINFSKKHSTILEILYVHEAPLFDIPDYFLSDEKIDENTIDTIKIKEKIQTHLDAFNLAESHAILVYLDDTEHQLLNHLKDEKHTLIVTAYQKTLTPQLIAKTPYTFWIIKNEGTEEYSKILFTSDLGEESRTFIPISQHLFSSSTLHLLYDYRYILETLALREDYLNVTPITLDVDVELNAVKKADALEKFNTYKKEFNLEGTFMEGEGFLEEDVSTFVKNNNFNLTIMYRKDEDFFASPSLIIGLVKNLPTDFLIF